MFSVEPESLLRIADELLMQKECLKKYAERLEQMSDRYLVRLTEDIAAEWKELYRMSVALQRISEIYKKQEERLSDIIDENIKRASRQSVWIDIHFTEENMELIKTIYV